MVRLAGAMAAVVEGDGVKTGDDGVKKRLATPGLPDGARLLYIHYAGTLSLLGTPYGPPSPA